MDHRLKQDTQIEDALKSQPLAPMPRSITMDVMTRIQYKNTNLVFFTWKDALLGLVIALSLGALIFAFQNFPPLILARLRLQGILLYQDFLINAGWLVPSLLFGAAAFFSAMTIPSVMQMTRRH